MLWFKEPLPERATKNERTMIRISILLLMIMIMIIMVVMIIL